MNGLEEYRGKRDFRKTAEPQDSGPGGSDEPIWVVQEHDASTRHFDFRLQVGDVLRSWAVPKGPSTSPRDKRLAVPTEDHPLGYAGFEGVIPEDEYGGGSVAVWDRGTYRNLRAEKEGDGASMEESLADGKAEVWLEGEKISGGYTLVRMQTGNEERWLLIKQDDDEADARRKPARTEPESVLSGRTVEEIAAEEGPDAEGADDEETDA